jgi:hypothetical protein
MREIAKCRGCGEDVIWLVTRNGKNMPIDAATVRPGDTMFDPVHHSSHFDTCPKADKFRKTERDASPVRNTKPMSEQITLMDSIEETEREMLLKGEEIVGTPGGNRRHVRSKLAPTMTRCYRVIIGHSKINPTDDSIEMCKECMGSLHNEKITKVRMGR